jgi:hypothetical protein
LWRGTAMPGPRAVRTALFFALGYCPLYAAINNKNSGAIERELPPRFCSAGVSPAISGKL